MTSAPLGFTETSICEIANGGVEMVRQEKTNKFRKLTLFTMWNSLFLGAHKSQYC
jgi:hypothetical protein